MLFTMSMTAFAAEAPEEPTTDTMEIEIPVVYFDSTNEYEQYLTALEETVSYHLHRLATKERILIFRH